MWSGAERVRWARPGLTRRTLVSTLKQSPESRRCGCDPGLPGDRAGQQQDYLRPTRRRTRARRLAGRMEMRDTTRRTSWPRASGPSSRTTGAEPACMAFGCACAPAPDARLCRAGAVRGAARYLPDRNVGFFGGASRTQPHEAVNRVRCGGEARHSRGPARRRRPSPARGRFSRGHGSPRRIDRRQIRGIGGRTPPGRAAPAAFGAIRFGRTPGFRSDGHPGVAR